MSDQNSGLIGQNFELTQYSQWELLLKRYNDNFIVRILKIESQYFNKTPCRFINMIWMIKNENMIFFCLYNV